MTERNPSAPHVRRSEVVLNPDPARVFLRAFYPTTDQRSARILARLAMLSDAETRAQLSAVLDDFAPRHRDVRAYFLRRFDAVKSLLLTDAPLSDERQLLIGAYFTMEYALEGAALFNPSLVWHPDQTGVPEGAKRFVLSLRATGEGHLSSIVFRTGTVDAASNISLDPAPRFVTGPETLSYPIYERALFERKLHELDHWDDSVATVLSLLPEAFTLSELQEHIQGVERQTHKTRRGEHTPLRSLLMLARANYEVTFSPDCSLGERVLFPTSPTEINGIEDARFVEFRDDDGTVTYFATYTAYDGKVAVPQILQTRDFLTFEMSTLNGPEVQNKGMALFPRKIGGRYAMLSRQDNENIFLMTSDNLHFWYAKEILLKPTYPWEFVQLGTCGSPIELPEGWLVITHGVGPMRTYVLGAALLDRDDPRKVLGRLREPLLTPIDGEREGYVPNVVYSCGAQVLHGELILPYAVSDRASGFATVPVAEILAAMV